MQRLLIFLALCLAVPCSFAVSPNVIVIMADDLGSVDLGCYGSKDLHTPHADALARQGLRFTQFYAGAPVCSPSRACLLTGRYPVRAGVPGNAGTQHGQKAGLPPSEVTLAEMFKSAGYATAHIGKWHLGNGDNAPTPEFQPEPPSGALPEEVKDLSLEELMALRDRTAEEAAGRSGEPPAPPRQN